MPIHPAPRDSHLAARTRGSDVVAGLLHDGHTALVAQAAVREAALRGTRVRFLQVLPPGLSEEDHSGVEAALFGIAIDALRASPRLPCTFESVVGTPHKTLVSQSREAALLVLGPDTSDATIRVADYCTRHCRCEVLIVTEAQATRTRAPSTT